MNKHVKNLSPLENLNLDLDQFREKIITWGSDNFRQFPWRYSENPYHILIAETLLHRTQAKQVVAVYLNFIERYPDPHSLSEANSEEIQNLVKSLGLFWRSALLSELGVDLKKKFGGQVPDKRDELLSLPGVGDYIASSVRCFAFGFPDAIIDTNVMRIITRVFGITFRDSLRRNRAFRALAQKLVDPVFPQKYNFAMLDLAYLICTVKDSACEQCPLSNDCLQYRMKNQELKPTQPPA